MIFKNLVSIAVVAMTASVAHATDLYVYSLSRTAPVAQLNSIQYVEFGTTDITVKQLTGTTTKVALTDFDFLKFSPATIVTAIGNVEGQNPTVTISQHKVTVTGGEIAALYTSDGNDGKLLATGKKGQQALTLPADSRHGIYIIKVLTANGTKSFKFTR